MIIGEIPVWTKWSTKIKLNKTIPISIHKDRINKCSSLNTGTSCHLKHPVVAEPPAWDEKNPVSFENVSRKQGNVVMHQNQYEIVMFVQWNVVLCQIQLRQLFSWLNASVCCSISWITLIPLARPLSAGRAWIFTSYGDAQRYHDDSVSAWSWIPPSTQVQVTDKEIQRDSWLFVLWFSVQLYADRHLDYFSYCYWIIPYL